jgi:hypothetical protein
MIASLPVVRALHDLAYLAGALAHVLAIAVFLGASALAVFTTDVLSEWVAWLGLAGSAASRWALSSASPTSRAS